MLRSLQRGLLLLSAALAGAAASSEVPRFDATLLKVYDSPDARQGVAVDHAHFYAVDNFRITKHASDSGKVVATWSGSSEGEPLIHLDSLMAMDGKLYASHSNYPLWPMTSSVEIWDSADLQRVGSHSFGISRGSLTWLDRHASSWWGAFANYDKVQDGQNEPYGHTDRTQVVQMDDQFAVRQSWTIPAAILDLMRPMSNSGGSWGPDGYLYLTGHDRGEAYVMCLPRSGSELTWVATVNIPMMEGQGIAWNRSTNERELWGILKSERKVLRIQMPNVELPVTPKNCSNR